MEADFSISNRSPLAREVSHLAHELIRRTSVAVSGVFLLVALMLVARREAGALTYPLGPMALASLGAAAACITLVAGLSLPRRNGLSGQPLGWNFWLSSAAAWLIAWAVSVPGTTGWGLAAMWFFVVGGQAGAWFLAGSPGAPAAVRNRWSILRRRDVDIQPSPSASSGDLRAFSQHLMRWQSADRTDTLGGQLRADFAAGQRTAAVHVAFCPPFAATPHLDWRYKGGPEARTKVAQLLPYGARFDVKLHAAAIEPCSVVLEFTATCSQVDDSGSRDPADRAAEPNRSEA